MDPVLFRVFSQLAPKTAPRRATPTWLCRNCRAQTSTLLARRTFTSTGAWNIKEKSKQPYASLTSSDSSYAQPAGDLSQDVTNVEKNTFDRIEEESKEKQRKAPWMREGSDKPPVARMRSASAMVKGKLLTTPSRMLKLILPLTTRDQNEDRKDVEPLALLVHPQQPLSYLERLVQSELPYIEDHGTERIPKVSFRAQDTTEEDIGSGKSAVEEVEGDVESIQEEDGTKERSGKIKSSKDHSPPARNDREAAATQEDAEHPNFVRWSPSTEIGDFIRDAAGGKEFAVDIEGAPPIYVGVPSFEDRTYYLRMRLRKSARRILQLADLKKECDDLAQRGAQRVAQGGFVALMSWWVAVYYLTFKTDLGWDVMEPVTYLVGLSGLIGGYMWFLYHNREVSYRSAMNFTISRRQKTLYDQKGFNLATWEGLVEEANRLRREIKMVADEYDVDWDETEDEHDEKVSQALRQERKKNQKKEDEEKDKEKDDDDD